MTASGDTRYDALISRAAAQVTSRVRTLLGTARPPDFPGYEVIAERQRGGQGAVIEAVHRSTGRRVAIKVLHGAPWDPDGQRMRFAREVQILARLRHPNVVAIHDSSTVGQHFYYIMDYVEGDPLDLWLARQGSMWTARDTLRLMTRVCAGVQAAHIHGVIHRDLKPANVMVDAAGEPRIVDFGLAKATPESNGLYAATTHTGQFIGSLPWSSPEQVTGHTVDTRSDVYALGVVMFHALTGAFPYDISGSMTDVVRHIAETEPLPPSRLRRELDSDIDTVVLTCLHKDGDRRYQTAGELGRDIERYLDGQPLAARRDSTIYLLKKMVRRHRLQLVAVLAFVTLLAGSSVVSWRLLLRAREATASSHQHLNEALISQAAATRRTSHAGRRFDALAALAEAARIAPTQPARDEAIAALALPDVRLIRQLSAGGTAFFDATLERCATVDDIGRITVSRTADDADICRIPAPQGGAREVHWMALAGRFLARIYDPWSGDRRLEVWTLPDAQLHFSVSDVPFQARFDISADGTTLAVGRTDGAVHLYDLESGAARQRIPLDRNPSYLSFDPTGQRLALYHGNFVDARIVDLATGHSESAFDGQPIAWSVAWHPEGRILAAAAGTSVVLWDTVERRICGTLDGHQTQVVHVRFSANGQWVMSYSWNGVTRLWDSRTRRLLLECPLAYPVFATDDRRIGATTTQGAIGHGALFELDGAQECRVFVSADDPRAAVDTVVEFDDTGQLLFVGQLSAVPEARGLRAFDVRSGAQVAASATSDIRCLTWDALSQSMVAGCADGIHAWPVHRTTEATSIGAPLQLIGGGAMTVALSADGNAAVMCAETAFDPQEIDGLRHPTVLTCDASGNLCHVRISPDGRWVAHEGWKRTPAEVRDARTRERVLELPSCSNGRLCFSADGRHMATCNADGISLWETGTWRVLQRIAGQFGPVRYSLDGRLLACAVGLHTIQLRDANTLEVVAVLDPPAGDATCSLAFSPDATLLAQGTNHGVTYVWDLPAIRTRLRDIGLDWTQVAPQE